MPRPDGTIGVGDGSPSGPGQARSHNEITGVLPPPPRQISTGRGGPPTILDSGGGGSSITPSSSAGAITTPPSQTGSATAFNSPVPIIYGKAQVGCDILRWQTSWTLSLGSFLCTVYRICAGPIYDVSASNIEIGASGYLLSSISSSNYHILKGYYDSTN